MIESEIDMVNKAVKIYKKQGFLVTTEVPFLHRSIDLVYKKAEELISIEFKLSNWKRAIKQAESHLLGSNKVYICILKPKKGLSPLLQAEIENSPIGLLFFDPDEETIEEIKPAEISQKIWAVGKYWLNKSFEERINAI